jgi:homoserine/homoserine lactone efflux protein
MDVSSYFLYLSVSVIASVSVGPSVILAANNGINFGRRKALSGVLGHVSAILILALISASGVGAILLASQTTFTLIKYLGVGYLIYIGLAIFKSKGAWSLQVDHDKIPSGLSLYRKGLTLGLSNPKALVFFTALFPQFISPQAPLLPQFLLLAGTSLVNAFVFTFGYALMAHQFKNKLLPVINNGWLGRISGTLFLGFAAALAIAR